MLTVIQNKINLYFLTMSRSAATNELYFVTLTVTDWIDVFTRRIYNDFIIENLNWCTQHKKLNIYAYVIMTNHIHLVADMTDGVMSDLLRDFKTYTSKGLVKLIRENQSESRREWMIRAFEKAGKDNPLNVHHQFWQNGNYPVVLYSPAVIDQKIDYIPACRLAGMKILSRLALLVQHMSFGTAVLIWKVCLRL